MYLYEKKDKNLDVYTFNCDKNLALQYREAEMKKIPEENRVLTAKFTGTSANVLGDSPFYVDCSDTAIMPAYIYHTYGGDTIYHEYIPLNDKVARQILLEKYCFGHFIDKKIVRMDECCKMKYLLLTQTTYCESCGSRSKLLNGIIQLPESLYLLQVLEQGKFSLLRELNQTLFPTLKAKDISEQLELFDITHVGDVSLEELQKMDSYGITQNIYEKTLEKAENDAHVLKLIKK